MSLSYLENELIKRYKAVSIRMIRLSYPQLNQDEISRAVDYSINKRCKNFDMEMENSYKKTKINKTALEMADYILTKKPIISMGGVLFERHADSVNPYYKLIDEFINQRIEYKAEMFKHPKGSEKYAKYNLLQLLAKTDANSIYGAGGMYTSLFYNLHVASSITRQGKSAISAAQLAFESFLANNVQFANLNEIVTYIDNVITETRRFDDSLILDENICLASAYFKIMSTCGFGGYYPTEDDMIIVWDIMKNLKQEDLNRLYYKNNLYDFLENKVVTEAITKLLTLLNKPFLDPNHVPKEIKPELEAFWELLEEYIYYGYQYIDRIERADTMIRDLVILVDTDSNILSVDAWYRCVLDRVYNVPMKIKQDYIQPVTRAEKDEYGDVIFLKPVKHIDPVLDYNFYTDEVIEKERFMSPGIICPQDGLRYSIINILAYCLTKMVDDYMLRYSVCSQTVGEDRPLTKFHMKSEFLFWRLLNTDGKKNYADKQETQEGRMVPESQSLAVMGLPINKNTLQKSTRDELKRILYDDILNTRKDIDQLQVLKDIIIFEKAIFKSLSRGERKYYKPVRIGSTNRYDNPLRIQGIKSSMIYNDLATAGMEIIDLSKRNSVDIIKVNINMKNAINIKDTYPEVYEKLIRLLNKDYTGGEITGIAMPKHQEVPKWIIEYIDYINIINDNVTNFPLESIGLFRMAKSSNKNSHSNILKI